ncbi:adenylyl cyclase [Mycobacterium sp. 852002-51613_SCH5001154]|uniref:ATP-binding protein n=1 Tax=Mycobacterium sp. 852002-51613_SCH5001154 TaxID=1834104 RepID=UPI000801C202|nr:adenylate/guanylate cyclase domain-containing protein [Mycobacterium sp. 852002-51613_SCH5001154]OBF72114.1 adenylyl cyclase [Mycobacterium sp. 852002-51613_SCH5001154]
MVSPVSEATGRCGLCGNDLRAKARFCDVCGAPVVPRPASGERKQVTVLFADVVGSMKLAAALDAELLQEIMNEMFNRAAAVVQRYHGTVDKFTGDGLMALFGAPVALEDHALRACISALEIQSVTKELAAEVLRRAGATLQVRVGLNSGAVIAGEIGSGQGRYTAVGHPVGMAQRMEAAAPPGGVMCSLSTARLVEEAARLGPVEDIFVKGADAPVPARQLLAMESERMVLGRQEGLMLGRDAEMRRLQTLFAAHSGCLVGIVGRPGLGKSRLLREFTTIAASQGADIVVARCEAHTSTVAFRALSRLLRAMFKLEGLSASEARERTSMQYADLLGRDSADAQILFEAMGIADTMAPHLQVSAEARRRRLIEILAHAVRARSTSTVFALEDAHWIDQPSDDVLADFASTLDGTTSMFVMTYRPEFRGALRNRSNQTVTLQPLTESTSVRLVRQLLGGDQSLGGLGERIAAAVAGNPFFAEEIVRDLAGRGVLSGGRGAYRLTGDADEIAVPATVQAVLAARIDRLPATTKSILNAAAVIGNHFDVDALHALLPESASTSLAELVSAELIDQIEFVPRQRYCFHHPLVRTVAYESQLSAVRVQAHRRLAAAIEARDAGAVDDNAALIATHLESGGELVQAYHWHLRAAERLRPRDIRAARAEWESARRIADGLSDDHEDVTAMRIAPRAMLISTALYVSDADGADGLYEELRGLSTQATDLTPLALATAGLIWSFSINDIRVPEALALASELEDMVSGIVCDAATRAIILNSLAFIRFANCEFDAALRVIDAILTLAGDVPANETVAAQILRGIIGMCLGDCSKGKRDFREGLEQAHTLGPLNYATMSHYAGTVAVLGLCRGDDLVDETREALRCGESLGDVSGIIATLWAHGSALLRTENTSRDEAIDLLDRARVLIEEHKLHHIGMTSIAADLAVDAARRGRIHEAIDDLRPTFLRHSESGSPVFVGCTAEALIELLVERGSVEDLREARDIVGRWHVRRPGIAATDLWWLKSRALLARAEGRPDQYAELSKAYLESCNKLDARGRQPEARRMVDESLALRRG